MQRGSMSAREHQSEKDSTRDESRPLLATYKAHFVAPALKGGWKAALLNRPLSMRSCLRPDCSAGFAEGIAQHGFTTPSEYRRRQVQAIAKTA